MISSASSQPWIQAGSGPSQKKAVIIYNQLVGLAFGSLGNKFNEKSNKLDKFNSHLLIPNMRCKQLWSQDEPELNYGNT